MAVGKLLSQEQTVTFCLLGTSVITLKLVR